MSPQPLKNLGLLPVPSELKPILGFLQRADELRPQEPIITYWALYHSAQVGISVRTKEPSSRAYLSSLLSALEKLKKEIGPNDAIDNDPVAAAYVENFALKVFTTTDSEDRAGKATRGTAKKFLVAANLLELLEAFDKANVSDSVDEKIRYAKWKAADIAKAFREGRKPNPGPANQEDVDSPAPDITIEAASPEQPTPLDYAGGWATSTSRFDPIPGSPGSWSTMATPGTADQSDMPNSPATGDPRRATVSNELEGFPEESLFEEPHLRRPTHSSSEQVQPTQPPSQPSEPGPKIPPPPGTSPTHGETHAASIDTTVNTAWEPPIQSYQQISESTFPSQRQPSQGIKNVASSPPQPPPPIASAPPLQLTPQQITQAQKHCRYAISALDYEDFVRAKKDLLDALRIIEGQVQ